MKRWQIMLTGIVMAVVSAIGGYLLQQKLTAKSEPGVVNKQITQEELIGTVVYEFTLADVNDDLRSLSEWKGNVIAINFWATWCPPCREEIPYFVELQQNYQKDGLQFIGVALQHADEIRDFLDEFNVNYPSLVGGDDVIELATRLGNGIGALPYTVIIDRDGKIAFTRRGPITKQEAESVIKTLL